MTFKVHAAHGTIYFTRILMFVEVVGLKPRQVLISYYRIESLYLSFHVGALTDRYIIATKGKAQIQLSPQNLLNFNSRQSGGSCNGGDHHKAYDFISKYGISDDSCTPFSGLNWMYGFMVAAMTEVDEVRGAQCYTCDWSGACGFVPE